MVEELTSQLAKKRTARLQAKTKALQAEARVAELELQLARAQNARRQTEA